MYWIVIATEESKEGRDRAERVEVGVGVWTGTLRRLRAYSKPV